MILLVSLFVLASFWVYIKLQNFLGLQFFLFASLNCFFIVMVLSFAPNGIAVSKTYLLGFIFIKLFLLLLSYAFYERSLK